MTFVEVHDRVVDAQCFQDGGPADAGNDLLVLTAAQDRRHQRFSASSASPLIRSGRWRK